MFSDKKDKKNMEPTASQNRINEGTTLKGDIQSKGFFRIDGVIDGNVNTPSKVVIGKTGVITGTLTCENADIEGTFDGKLDVTGTLTLKATARITGEHELPSTRPFPSSRDSIRISTQWFLPGGLLPADLPFNHTVQHTLLWRHRRRHNELLEPLVGQQSRHRTTPIAVAHHLCPLSTRNLSSGAHSQPVQRFRWDLPAQISHHQ